MEENLDNLTVNIQGALVDIALEILGNTRKKKKPRVTDEIMDIGDAI